MPKVIPQGPEGTIWFGGDPDETCLCLRICGDTLDPACVSRSLGCQPSRTQRKGEPVLSANGEPKRIARTGSWLLNHRVAGDVTIGEAIALLLRTLPADKSVWTSLTSRFTVDLICDVTVRCVNRGFDLPPEVLALVAERGITLSFDILCQADPRNIEAVKERLSPPDQSASDATVDAKPNSDESRRGR